MKNALSLVLLVALIAGCKDNKKNELLSEKAINVKTAVVRAIADDFKLSYSGTVEASQVIPLTFRTAGTVEKVLVDVGDPVRKGQVLATLDDSDLQNIYNTTLAKYQQAEDAYNRLKLVYDEGSLPEIKWVEMKADFEQARSALELAQNNLDKCKLVAPTDGIVGRRNTEPGQSSISLTLAPIELVKIEKVLVKISVPENEINKVRDGQPAEAVVSALGGKKFDGEVTHISPVAELMSRTYTVKIAVNNTDHGLKPGMVCDVSLNHGSGDPVLVVPNKAVSKDTEGRTFVFIVDPANNTVRKQPVTVGSYHGTGIEITGGLSEGQVIVREGMDKLTDKSKIEL
jgi:RND family efflux transporter MFP subunit